MLDAVTTSDICRQPLVGPSSFMAKFSYFGLRLFTSSNYLLTSSQAFIWHVVRTYPIDIFRYLREKVESPTLLSSFGERGIRGSSRIHPVYSFHPRLRFLPADIRPFGPFADRKDLLHRYSAVRRHPCRLFLVFTRRKLRFESPTLLSSFGERGIRTLGTLAGSTVFETARFNRSRISPGKAAVQQNAPVHHQVSNSNFTDNNKKSQEL